MAFHLAVAGQMGVIPVNRFHSIANSSAMIPPSISLLVVVLVRTALFLRLTK